MESLNSPPRFVYVHGFLGLPSDWDAIKNDQDDAVCLDLFRDPILSPRLSLQEWGSAFLKRFSGYPVIGVGYSLGGRLLLHAFHQNPQAFQHLVLIGAHPGIEDEFEKRGRLSNEGHWAQEFMSQKWDITLAAWNAQSVFANSLTEPVRHEKDYDREKLALALTKWSLGVQESFWTTCASNAHKITYICGENDAKFKRVAMELKASGLSRVHIFPRSGHRVIFDQPKLVSKVLQELNEKSSIER